MRMQKASESSERVWRSSCLLMKAVCFVVQARRGTRDTHARENAPSPTHIPARTHLPSYLVAGHNFFLVRAIARKGLGRDDVERERAAHGTLAVVFALFRVHKEELGFFVSFLLVRTAPRADAVEAKGVVAV